MKLNEFFGNIKHDTEQDKDLDPQSIGKEEEQEIEDQAFYYILDNNELHKKYFMPAAKELVRIHKTDTKADDLVNWKTWMPMVNAGCMDFYQEQDLKKRPEDIFTKEVRVALCKRLTDHYHDDILKDSYNLGK